MVRSWLCLHGKATARNLHRATVGYVAAPAQARRAERILPLLTQEEEADVFRRGRTPPPTLSPRGPAVGSIRLPPPWRPCSAGSISRGRTDRLNQLFSTMMEGSCDPPNL